MAIPERFAPRPPSDAEVRAFSTLCDEIENGAIAKADVTALLARWNARANRDYEAYEFKTYYGAMDQDQFVNEALAPRAGFVADLTYAELRAVFECVMASSIPEWEHSYFLGWLDVQFPGSNISDLIFWPDQWFGVDAAALKLELSADQLIAALMENSGRRLADAPEVSLPFAVPKRRA